MSDSGAAGAVTIILTMNSWRALLALPAMMLACALWTLAGRVGDIPFVQRVSADMRQGNTLPDPDYSERQAWQPLDQHRLAQMRGPYWLRLRFRLGSDQKFRKLALSISLRAASEVYWDGALLGRNGRVGRSYREELPGDIDWLVPLPREALAAGEHELLLRASSHHLGFEPRSADFSAHIAPMENLFSARYGPWLVAALAVGSIALAWLYFAMVLWRGRRASMPGAIALLGIGVVGLLLPLAEAWRPLLGYTYDLHFWRLCLVVVLTASAAILLPRYIAARFESSVPLPLGVLFVLTLVAGALLIPSFDGKNLILHAAGLLAALWLALRALRQGHRDAGSITALLLATLTLLVVSPAQFLDGLYFIALSVLMVFLLLRHVSHLLTLGELNAQLDAQRAKLAMQLLRNSIHPHWLMNTLTSLQELIEQAPAKATRMVDLLAREFRLLREIGESALIPLSAEIDLCRSHLDIVAMAHEASIVFTVEGDSGGIDVPPGVLHTLVENGLTHAGVKASARDGFLLAIERRDGTATLRLRSALGRALHASTGTGTRFVEASLAAAFGPHGSLRQQPADGKWLSELFVPCAS